jgi:hypothetical protein
MEPKRLPSRLRENVAMDELLSALESTAPGKVAVSVEVSVSEPCTGGEGGGEAASTSEDVRVAVLITYSGGFGATLDGLRLQHLRPHAAMLRTTVFGRQTSETTAQRVTRTKMIGS